jgi:hypothetical protein
MRDPSCRELIGTGLPGNGTHAADAAVAIKIVISKRRDFFVMFISTFLKKRLFLTFYTCSPVAGKRADSLRDNSSLASKYNDVLISQVVKQCEKLNRC